MNKIATFFIFLVIFQFFTIPNALKAFDNYSLLKKGNEERALGNLDNAANYYIDYIASHPFSDPAVLRGQPLKNSQNYISNLLKAYENLLDIIRDNGRNEQKDLWLQKLSVTYDPEKFRLKNRYTLARILLENNWVEKGTQIFEAIIADHLSDYSENNNKVFLRAASKLAQHYRKEGNSEKLEALYGNLNKVSIEDFDLKDKLNLAKLYLSAEKLDQHGENLLTEIFSEIPDNNEHLPTLFAAGTQLMAIQYQKGDLENLKITIKRVKDNLTKQTPPGTIYNTAVALIKCDEKKEGIQLLQGIIKKHSDTLWARKSHFLLGRIALSGEDWDSAIEYFSSYISKYPEQTFFSLKAYSNLLDAHWAKNGNLSEQNVELKYFAEILNETADYETQLNMAREIHQKGSEQLAVATFALGRKSAQEIILRDPRSLKAMRANWQLAKYGYELGDQTVARNCGENVIALHSELQEQLPGLEEKNKADHYLSSTLLWLAKIYEKEKEELRAKEVLMRFLQDYPANDDTDYATYQLARLHENDQQLPEAAKNYQMIRKGPWHEKAQTALKRIGVQSVQ